MLPGLPPSSSPILDRPLLSSPPSLAHHHLAELVKVHGAGAVLVDLLDDAVQVLLRQPGVQLRDDLPQLKGGYSALS